MTAPADRPLARRLGLGDAVAIGLGSMIGAGVFSAFAPAAAAAGSGLLIGLAIAAVIAYCNAAASAQLAAQYPTSGGTYIYGRERLGPWAGFAAGWAFVIGKTASCAAMALTFATYAVGDSAWARPVAVAATLCLTLLNCRGITRTALLTRLFAGATLAVLAVLVIGIAVGPHTALRRIGGWDALGSGGAHGTLQAAGLLFFAFAGYARIATMGEEVRDPRGTIPRAIQLALGIAVAAYVCVALALLAASGPDALGAATAPLADAARDAGVGALAPLARIGAAVAALGALLALIAGVGRTALAMARQRDLPRWLAAVHPRFQVPHHAELALGFAVAALVLLVDLRGAIGFSSFGVLLYYAIANASAWTQPRSQRRWPRALNALGLCGCVVLALSLPWQSIAAGAAVIAVGFAGRAAVLRRRRAAGATAP